MPPTAATFPCPTPAASSGSAHVESFSDPESKWEYQAQLRLFVDGGMEDGSRFIDAVSSVLTRGCNKYYCSKQTIHYMEEQRRNFETLIYDVLNLRGRLEGLPPRPVPRQTYDFEHAMQWIHSKWSKIEGNVFVLKNYALDRLLHFSQPYKFEPVLLALCTISY